MRIGTTKDRFLATTLLAGMTVLGGTGVAAAQEAADAGDEVIVVTGTRIARPNLVSPVPVSSFDAQMIEQSGELNVADVLRELPAAGVSALSASNSNFLTASNGINTIDLRNLGEDRTLVLVNGRRFVSGLPGTQIVDLNSIPTDFIERVDVITGGASAVYGSDALAGVVNIILKDDFEGFELTAQGGRSFEFGDDERYKISATAGSNFDGGRGNAAFNVTWDTANGIAARNRPTMDADYSWTFPTTGDLSDYVGPAFSSYIPQGRFRLPTTGASLNRVVQDDGTITPYVASRDGFNRNAQRELLVPTERLLASGMITYEIAPFAEFFSEMTYAQTEFHAYLEPVPYDSSQVYDSSSEYCSDFDSDGDTECRFGIPLTNPLIPQAIADEVRALWADDPLTATVGDALSDDELVVGFARRLSDIDQRGNDGERQTFRIASGMRGDITDNLAYEFSVVYGRTTDFQTSRGDVNSSRVAFALDAIDDGNGNIVCRDEGARAAGCVPLDLFGRGSITPEARQYIGIQTSRNQEAEQTIVNGFVTGNLFELPAGPLGFVLGAEYRHESASDIPDPLTQSGEASGNATPPTIGQFNVREVFGELSVPLLRDLPLIQSLDLNLAARVSDYSTVGGTEAYAVSLDYQPIDEVRLRGQYSRAVRAPNITELYSPLAQDFPNVTDPCRGVTQSGGQAAFMLERGGDGTTDPADVLSSGVDASTIGDQVAENCLADPLVLARVQRDGAFALSQGEVQGVSGFDGGSTALDAETAETFTAGILFNPAWSPLWEPLSVSIDYYAIRIEDSISVIPEQTSADSCYVAATSFDPGSAFCSNIERFASGPQLGALRYVNQQNQNLALERASGLDIQASYGFDFGDFGTLNTNLIWSHIYKLETVPYAGAPYGEYIIDRGTIGASEDEIVLSFTYGWNDLTVAWNIDYIGEAVVTNDPDNTEDFGTTIGGEFIRAEVDAQTFHDMQIRYDILPNVTAFFGVDNVFDEYVLFGGTQVPPGPDGKPTGWSTYPDVYDGLRRRGYAGVRMRF